MERLEEYKSTLRRIIFLKNKNVLDFDEMVEIELYALRNLDVNINKEKLLIDLECMENNEPLKTTDFDLRRHIEEPKKVEEIKPKSKIKSLVKAIRKIV